MIDVIKPEANKDLRTDLYTEILLGSGKTFDISSKYSSDHGYTWSDIDDIGLSIPYDADGIQPGFMRSEIVVSSTVPNERYINLNRMKLNPAPLSEYIRSKKEEGSCNEINLNEGLFYSAELKDKTYYGVTDFREQGNLLKPERINSSLPSCSGIKCSKKNWQSLPPGPLRDTLGNDNLKRYVDRGSPWVEIGVAGNSVDLEVRSFHFQLSDIHHQWIISVLKTEITNESGSPFKNIALNYYFDKSVSQPSDELISCSPDLNLASAAVSGEPAGWERKLSGFAFIDGPQMPGGRLLNSFGVHKKYTRIDAEQRESVLNLFDTDNEDYNLRTVNRLLSKTTLNRRYYLSSVPFDLTSGDTEEIILASFEFNGVGNEPNIDQLKEKLDFVKSLLNGKSDVYYSEEATGGDYPIPPKFDIKVFVENGSKKAWRLYLYVPDQPGKRRSKLKVNLIDIFGRKVYKITEGEYLAGIYNINVDPEVVNMPKGLYFCVLEAGENVRSRKSLLLR